MPSKFVIEKYSPSSDQYVWFLYDKEGRLVCKSNDTFPSIDETKQDIQIIKKATRFTKTEIKK